MVRIFDLSADELDAFLKCDVKADLCHLVSCRESRKGLPSSRLMMYQRKHGVDQDGKPFPSRTIDMLLSALKG